MDLSEVARTHYFQEVQRRNDLNNSLNLLTGLLVALFAALGTMASSVTRPIDLVEWVLLALCGVGAGAGIWAVGHVIAAYLPRPNEHPKYLSEIRAEVDGWAATGANATAISEKLAELMTDAYSRSADINARNNDAKNSHIVRAGKRLAWLVVVTVVAAAPYLINKISDTTSLAKGSTGSISSVHLEFRGSSEQQPTPTSTPASPSASTSAPAPQLDEDRSGERVPVTEEVEVSR